jgi:crotonobetainyl-CoA:carnitine CoA-transferase CaiB-like acyl-CoA transferase
MATQAETLPLEGVRVCDFTWIVAGPQATRILADMGADVIKVESESVSDALRGVPGLHNNFHRNKRSITANIYHPKGREVVERLVAVSDIVIENFSTGTLARMGLPYERLVELRPDVIYISLSGYGQLGRDATYGTWGPTAQGASGLTAMSRLPGQPPAGWGYSYLDHTGGFYGPVAALMALWHREQTGEGQHIDMSQVETGMVLAGLLALDYEVNGRRYEPIGNRSRWPAIAPHGIYRCAGDDRWIAIVAEDEAQWRALCEVLGVAALGQDARFGNLDGRLAAQDDLDAAIESATRARRRGAGRAAGGARRRRGRVPDDRGPHGARPAARRARILSRGHADHARHAPLRGAADSLRRRATGRALRRTRDRRASRGCAARPAGLRRRRDRRDAGGGGDLVAGPMTGVRVVEVGDLGEVAGKLLADAGADVIRVEPPGGARSRHTGPFVDDRPDPNGCLRFAYLNTNKRGVTLDLAAPGSPAAWRRLIGNADVVLDAAGPGVLDAHGAGYEASRELERLVWCAVTPFGLDGPWRDRPANDLVNMALGGIVMMCGYDDHELPPVRPDGDHSLAMGGEYAAMAIIAALLQRERSGRGPLLDVAIHEAVAGTTEGAFWNWEYNGVLPQRRTGRHAGTDEEWQLEADEGGYVVVFGGGVPRSRDSLRQLLAWMDEHGAAGALHDPRYEELLTMPPLEATELRGEFSDAVMRFLRSRPAEEVYRRGQAIDMAWAPVRSPEDNLDDPHWADRGFWVEGEVAGFDKTVRYPRAGYRFMQTPVELRRRAPLLGEHNREVLVSELGLVAGDLPALTGLDAG